MPPDARTFSNSFCLISRHFQLSKRSKYIIILMFVYYYFDILFLSFFLLDISLTYANVQIFLTDSIIKMVKVLLSHKKRRILGHKIIDIFL